MKRILLLILILISVESFSQGWKVFKVGNVEYYQFTPPNNYAFINGRYRWLATMADSGMHIPSYNGTPVGTRTNVWPWDGAIAMDTTNHRLYIFSGNAWNRVANFSEVSSISQLFGHPSGDFNIGQDRYANFHGTRSFWLDSLAFGLVTYDQDGGFTFQNMQTGNPGLQLDVIGGRIYSPNGINNAQVDNGRAALIVDTGDSILLSSVSGKVYIPNIPYNSGAGIVHLGLDTVAASPTFNKLVRKTAGATSTNIYNTDGTLTGNRTVTQSSNVLTFNGDNSVANVNINQTGGFGSALYLASSGSYTLFSDNSVGTYGAYLRTTNSSTNTVLPVLHLERNSTGTAAAGIGTGIRFTNQFGDGTQGRTHDINAKLTNVTAGAFTGEFDLLSYDAGSLETFMNIQASGVVRVNNLADTLATKAYARSVGGGGGGSGTVTDVSVVTANGFSGSVATSTTTPAITLNNNNVNFQTWYQHYIDIATGSNSYFWISSSGTGSAVSRPSTAIADGWMSGLQFSTGTTTTGLAYAHLANAGTWAPIAISNSYRYNYGGKLRLEDLSDATEWYTILLGFSDNGGMGTNTDAVCFTYSHSQSSGQFVCHTKSNGSVTSTASGITVAADTDYDLEISVIGGSAFFYINKTLVHTETSTIPTGTARATSGVFMMEKIDGTTARLAYLEYMAYGKRNN